MAEKKEWQKRRRSHSVLSATSLQSVTMAAAAATAQFGNLDEGAARSLWPGREGCARQQTATHSEILP